MNEAEKLAGAINKALPNVKSGTLRFFGQWFGRPYDNVHRLVRCESEQNLLKLYFNENEVLYIWSPKGLKIDSSVFSIENADRVRWEWFYYGRPQIASNIYFEDYAKSANKVSATTNVDWYKPDLKPTASSAAVEIL